MNPDRLLTSFDLNPDILPGDALNPDMAKSGLSSVRVGLFPGSSTRTSGRERDLTLTHVRVELFCRDLNPDLDSLAPNGSSLMSGLSASAETSTRT